MNVRFQKLMPKTVLVYALCTMQAHLLQVLNNFNCSFIKEDVTELYFPTTLFTVHLPSVSPLVVISFPALKSFVPHCIEAARQHRRQKNREDSPMCYGENLM